MRVPITLAALLLVFVTVVLVVSAQSGQKMTCRCEKKNPDSCGVSVTCSDGCTGLCGSGVNQCYTSCRKGCFAQRFTIKFVKKTGQEIASELSLRSHQRIKFKPYLRQNGEQYDLDIQNDDLFNALNFLNKVGNVTYNGIDFAKQKQLCAEKRNGKTITP